MDYRLGACLLLERLEENKMNQADFARVMGVSRQFVNKLITGERKMSLEFAFNAAYRLNCRITDLYVLEVVRKQVE
ncbi:helix-turn-helix transcriptional regulator [Paenibacillus ottowii]|uniref:Helix-turn-helix transcriptional regulator n=1 Tax=Paenibacillus ottowii TaxID=2315729 RepID=A0ABY3BC27_9BACL|nr:helix-turn-helix transcriptional regulator [Paenibacillus ottowii]TQS01397.1 helix-turn-helix transcriptional regulator [Paenibacillus ottowii]TQS01452.1 helix-turn-helix transcriptional regulator [Paenibacillus ottowii]